MGSLFINHVHWKKKKNQCTSYVSIVRAKRISRGEMVFVSIMQIHAVNGCSIRVALTSTCRSDSNYKWTGPLCFDLLRTSGHNLMSAESYCSYIISFFSVCLQNNFELRNLSHFTLKLWWRYSYIRPHVLFFRCSVFSPLIGWATGTKSCLYPIIQMIYWYI